MTPNPESFIVISQFCRDGFFKHNPSITENDLMIRLRAAIEKKQFRLPAEHRRDGHVWLVSVDPTGFTSRVKKLQAGDYLLGRFQPRVKDESPRKSVKVLVNELSPGNPAVSVDVVLYSEKALCEDPDHVEQDCDFEVVTVLSKACEGDEPMDLDTLLHNHFLSDGGTATGMSNDEFVEALQRSFEYWKNHAQIY